MKRWLWFVLIGSLVGIPILVLHRSRKVRLEQENLRYDINDYVGDEL